MIYVAPLRPLRTLTLAFFLPLLLPSGAAAQPPAGAQGQQPPSQPPAAGAQNQNQNRGNGGGNGGGVVDAAAQEDPNNVLKATNAREVASVSCTTGSDDQCRLDKNALKAIAESFNGALLGPDGKDTSALAKAVKAFLEKPGDATVWDRKAVKYALVHLVKYDSDGNAHDKWIFATAGKGGAIELSDSLHIPGAHTIALVFVHLNASVSVAAPEKGKQPEATRQEVLDVYGNISYRAIIARKLPINIQHLLALLKLSAGILEAKEEKVSVMVSLVGFGVMSKVDVPSDVTVFGVRLSDTQPKLIGQSQKYDNEGKYWWDASVAVPVNKLTLLDYDSENGVFTPKTINKQSIYGIINLYPDFVDLKYGNKRWLMPRAIAGIGLTGRPGENFLIGGAWGIEQFQFFVGSGFANHRVLLPGADPKSGAGYTQRYSSHLTFGINVPVFSAIKKMAAAKSASAASGDTSKSTKQ